MNKKKIQKKKLSDKVLDLIEKSGNLLPDPAMMFFVCLLSVIVLSWIFSNISFLEIDPRTGEALKVINLLTGANITVSELNRALFSPKF